MRFSVSHETKYHYSEPIALGPHVVRLNPRPDRIRVRTRRLLVEPEPVEQYEVVDAFGNVVTRLSFAGTCDVLRIRSEFEVDSLMPDPICDESLSVLPWHSAEDDLKLFRRLDPGSDRVCRFAFDVSREVGNAPIAFLDRLNRTLYERTDRHIRPSGPARTPAETLDRASGACRDLALLFIEACRCVGLASRFVSGYQAAHDTPDQLRHLHAWAETFLPGHGWCGWDPMHGVRVNDSHVALCAAPDQADTMPVDGGYTFSGKQLTSTLDYTIVIHTS